MHHYTYIRIEQCWMHLYVYLYIDTLYINTDFLPKDNSGSHEHYEIWSRVIRKKNNRSAIPVIKSVLLLLIFKSSGF